MTPDAAAAAFIDLSLDQQVRVLARYAFQLTIVARGTYVVDSEDIADPARLRMLNEVQHRITGHLDHLLAADPQRFDDDSIVRIIVADDAELLRTFDAVLQRFR